jgi:hypothetical protein
MDAGAHQLTAALVTDQDLLDRNAVADLLDQTAGTIESVCADGAYDFEQCYRAIKKRQAKALIPPRKDAIIRAQSPFEQRDENLRGIRRGVASSGRETAPITVAHSSSVPSSD